MGLHSITFVLGTQLALHLKVILVLSRDDDLGRNHREFHQSGLRFAGEPICFVARTIAAGVVHKLRYISTAIYPKFNPRRRRRRHQQQQQICRFAFVLLFFAIFVYFYKRARARDKVGLSVC